MVSTGISDQRCLEHLRDLRPQSSLGARLLNRLESQLPPLTSCVILGSFSNLSVFWLHFHKT